MRRMQLCLASSLGIGDRAFLECPAADGRALVVANARDAMGDARPALDKQVRTVLRDLGYRDVSELDLREHFAEPGNARLRTALDEAHLVWVLGGNAFVLARAMAASAFGRAMAKPLREGRLTYRGDSAGACVAGPDLTGMEHMNDPDVLPDGYDTSPEPQCLGLVPFRIVPHWNSGAFESPAAATMATQLQRDGLDHRALRDGEVITFG